ncbi:MAG: NAD(P)H-hydrate epimerase [Thaumarchaeota archaeon]|nr:NAD(P)H-hydrate epimerase [Nitrososphaerota archaeon]
MRFITPHEMAEIERAAMARGTTIDAMMENAGRQVALAILERYPASQRITFVCGKGNNGGDGFVAARHLQERGKTVRVVLLGTPESIRTQEARANWRRLEEAGVRRTVVGTNNYPRELATAISGADIIVDGIFGAGVKGEIREPFATAINMINRSPSVKVAIDLPSGLDPATGDAKNPTIRADLTLAIHAAKTGLKDGAEYAGEIVVVPIGLD